jgi:hypothetical protein
MKIKSVAKKNNIPEQVAIDAVLLNHAYTHLYKKNELKKLQVDIEPDTLKLLRKKASALKVSDEALIVALIMFEIGAKK